MSKTVDLDFLREQVEEAYKIYQKKCTFKCFHEYDLNFACGKFTMAAELGVISVQRADDMVHELVRTFDVFHHGINPEVQEIHKFNTPNQGLRMEEKKNG